MSTMTVNEIYQVIERLSSDDQRLLMERLQAKLQDTAQAKHESLFGKFARPGLDIDEEELNAYRREIASAWKEDLDGLDAD